MPSRGIPWIVDSSPKHFVAERVIGEVHAHEEVVHEIVGRVVTHPDLFEDDLPLGVDVVGTERRTPQDVGEDVDRELEARVGQPHVEHGLLVGRERVHLAADRLHRLRDLARRAPVGALEQQVFEEVRSARLLGRFVSCSTSYPRTDRDRPGGGQRFGDDAQTRRELRTANVVVGHLVLTQRRGPRTAAGATATTATGTAAVAAAIPTAVAGLHFFGRAEVAELLPRLALPERLERGGLACGGARRTPGGARRRRTLFAAAAPTSPNARPARREEVRRRSRSRRSCCHHRRHRRRRCRHRRARARACRSGRCRRPSRSARRRARARLRPGRCACPARASRCGSARRGREGCSRTHRTW